MNELHYQLDLLKAMNQKLLVKEKMYRMICDTSDTAFLYIDFEKNDVVTLGNWRKFFQFDVTTAKDLSLLLDEVEEKDQFSLRNVIFLEKTGKQEAIHECMLKDEKHCYSFKANIVYDDLQKPLQKLIAIEDVTKLHIQNDNLAYMAHYDFMTGLYSRNYFITLLAAFLERAEAENCNVAVIVIDIDDFKKVNDGMGMVSGDELILNFGMFLKELSDENILSCHLNNDVYYLAVYEPTGSRSVENLRKRIQARTKQPFLLSNGKSVTITVSMGVAEFPTASKSALELINCAEIVMFRCKSNGKNSIQYFDAPILKEFLKNIEMENKLKEAVFHNNFLLHFQPQYYTGNKKFRGVEALIRWKDEQGSMISPKYFIPIAEKNGCIVPIGNWVVEESIRQFAKWRDEYHIPFVMSINISSVQYSQENFVSDLLDAMKKYHVHAGDIEIEITESIMIEDFETVIAKLKCLREAGVRVSLDDFGTGFSSLSYLKRLPIDTLKIDKSFVDTLLSDGATRIITESIINMVKALGVESIAEGVENEAQYNYLHAVGCDVIQGYFLGRPKTPEQIEEILDQIANE